MGVSRKVEGHGGWLDGWPKISASIKSIIKKISLNSSPFE